MLVCGAIHPGVSITLPDDNGNRGLTILSCIGNTAVAFNSSTNVLTVSDSGGNLTATINEEADDLGVEKLSVYGLGTTPPPTPPPPRPRTLGHHATRGIDIHEDILIRIIGFEE